MQDKKQDISLTIPNKDAPIAAFMLWNALCESLKMLAETRGKDGWKAELYSRCQSAFDDPEVQTSGDQTIFQKSGIETSRAAIESGSKMIDAAFDRIVIR